MAAPVTLARLRDEYLATHRGSLEANTLSVVATHFKHFADSLGERFPVGSLVINDLQRHANHRAGMTNKKGRPITPVTIKQVFVALRAVWDWGVHAGLVAGSFPPLKRVRLGKAEEKPPFQTRAEIEWRIALGGLTGHEADALWECLYLTPEEVKELLEHVRTHAAYPWLYSMACVAAHTGARRSELLRMEAGDVDAEERRSASGSGFTGPRRPVG